MGTTGIQTMAWPMKPEWPVGTGPWSPEVLAEDERHLAEFKRTREGIPWAEVESWMRSWRTPNKLPAPEPRNV
jgi:hypothetical protein